MDKIQEWIRAIKTAYQNHKRWFTVGLPLLVYLLGVLATGVDKSYKGFKLNPFVAIPTLFSRSGRAMISLLILIPLLVWALFKMRGLQYSGMAHDEKRNFWFSDKDTYGTAELMDSARMHQYFNCVPEKRCREAEGDIIGIKDKVVLSRPKDSRHNKHMAVIGASGSMKSRAIIRNKIIGSKRRGESMVVTDPKGELFRESATWLRKNGYTVRALNLASLSKSHGWNFMMDALRYCEDGEESEIVSQMAHVMIENTGGTAAGHSKDDFWDKGEKGLLKAIMLYQYYIWKLGTGPLSFPWAYKFLMDNTIDQLKAAFSDLDKRMPMNGATSAFSIFLKAGEKNGPNIQYGLLSRLDIFKDTPMQRIAGSDEIDLELPAKEKCAYFVITPDQHSTYDFIACLFFTLLFIRLVKYADTKTVTGKCDIPVNIILDEFPNIGEIPDFPKKIATVRSRDVNICIAFQSIPDLTERYPEPGHYRILNNCDYFVFLGGGDPLTAEFFSERSGETTVLVDTKMENHNKLDPLHFTLDQRESSGAGRRMVMTLNEIQTMAKDNPYAELIVMRDQPILECEKFDYTRDPDSKEWEVFAMADFDPHAPFWFDYPKTEPENTPVPIQNSQKTAEDITARQPQRKEEPLEQAPFSLPAKEPQSFQQKDNVEQESMSDFMRQRVQEMRSAQEQETSCPPQPPKQGETERLHTRVQSAIPALKRPPMPPPNPNEDTMEAKVQMTKGSKIPPSI